MTYSGDCIWRIGDKAMLVALVGSNPEAEPPTKDIMYIDDDGEVIERTVPDWQIFTLPSSPLTMGTQKRIKHLNKVVVINGWAWFGFQGLYYECIQSGSQDNGKPVDVVYLHPNCLEDVP